MKQLKYGSHLLKHAIESHETENWDDLIFNLKVIKFTRTSFERQILESVVIQQERSHHLLNSKAEYNRCAVPRLTTKIGENDYKKWEEKSNEENLREEALEEKIRRLRKDRNLTRRTFQKDQPSAKRRKITEEKYEENRPEWGRPENVEKGEKRERKDQEREQEPPPKRRKEIPEDKGNEEEDQYKEERLFYDWDKKTQYRKELEIEENGDKKG